MVVLPVVIDNALKNLKSGNSRFRTEGLKDLQSLLVTPGIKISVLLLDIIVESFITYANEELQRCPKSKAAPRRRDSVKTSSFQNPSTTTTLSYRTTIINGLINQLCKYYDTSVCDHDCYDPVRLSLPHAKCCPIASQNCLVNHISNVLTKNTGESDIEVQKAYFHNLLNLCCNRGIILHLGRRDIVLIFRQIFPNSNPDIPSSAAGTSTNFYSLGNLTERIRALFNLCIYLRRSNFDSIRLIQAATIKTTSFVQNALMHYRASHQQHLTNTCNSAIHFIHIVALHFPCIFIQFILRDACVLWDCLFTCLNTWKYVALKSKSELLDIIFIITSLFKVPVQFALPFSSTFTNFRLPHAFVHYNSSFQLFYNTKVLVPCLLGFLQQQLQETHASVFFPFIKSSTFRDPIFNSFDNDFNYSNLINRQILCFLNDKACYNNREQINTVEKSELILKAAYLIADVLFDTNNYNGLKIPARDNGTEENVLKKNQHVDKPSSSSSVYQEPTKIEMHHHNYRACYNHPSSSWLTSVIKLLDDIMDQTATPQQFNFAWMLVSIAFFENIKGLVHSHTIMANELHPHIFKVLNIWCSRLAHELNYDSPAYLSYIQQSNVSSSSIIVEASLERELFRRSQSSFLLSYCIISSLSLYDNNDDTTNDNVSTKSIYRFIASSSSPLTMFGSTLLSPLFILPKCCVHCKRLILASAGTSQTLAASHALNKNDCNGIIQLFGILLKQFISTQTALNIFADGYDIVCSRNVFSNATGSFQTNHSYHLLKANLLNAEDYQTAPSLDPSMKHTSPNVNQNPLSFHMAIILIRLLLFLPINDTQTFIREYIPNSDLDLQNILSKSINEQDSISNNGSLDVLLSDSNKQNNIISRTLPSGRLSRQDIVIWIVLYRVLAHSAISENHSSFILKALCKTLTISFNDKILLAQKNCNNNYDNNLISQGHIDHHGSLLESSFLIEMSPDVAFNLVLFSLFPQETFPFNFSLADHILQYSLPLFLFDSRKIQRYNYPLDFMELGHVITQIMVARFPQFFTTLSPTYHWLEQKYEPEQPYSKLYQNNKPVVTLPNGISSVIVHLFKEILQHLTSSTFISSYTKLSLSSATSTTFLNVLNLLQSFINITNLLLTISPTMCIIYKRQLNIKVSQLMTQFFQEIDSQLIPLTLKDKNNTQINEEAYINNQQRKQNDIARDFSFSNNYPDADTLKQPKVVIMPCSASSKSQFEDNTCFICTTLHLIFSCLAKQFLEFFKLLDYNTSHLEDDPKHSMFFQTDVMRTIIKTLFLISQLIESVINSSHFKNRMSSSNSEMNTPLNRCFNSSVFVPLQFIGQSCLNWLTKLLDLIFLEHIRTMAKTWHDEDPQSKDDTYTIRRVYEQKYNHNSGTLNNNIKQSSNDTILTPATTDIKTTFSLNDLSTALKTEECEVKTDDLFDFHPSDLLPSNKRFIHQNETMLSNNSINFKHLQDDSNNNDDVKQTPLNGSPYHNQHNKTLSFNVATIELNKKEQLSSKHLQSESSNLDNVLSYEKEKQFLVSLKNTSSFKKRRPSTAKQSLLSPAAKHRNTIRNENDLTIMSSSSSFDDLWMEDTPQKQQQQKEHHERNAEGCCDDELFYTIPNKNQCTDAASSFDSHQNKWANNDKSFILLTEDNEPPDMDDANNNNPMPSSTIISPVPLSSCSCTLCTTFLSRKPHLSYTSFNSPPHRDLIILLTKLYLKLCVIMDKALLDLKPLIDLYMSYIIKLQYCFSFPSSSPASCSVFRTYCSLLGLHLWSYLAWNLDFDYFKQLLFYKQQHNNNYLIYITNLLHPFLVSGFIPNNVNVLCSSVNCFYYSIGYFLNRTLILWGAIINSIARQDIQHYLRTTVSSTPLYTDSTNNNTSPSLHGVPFVYSWCSFELLYKILNDPSIPYDFYVTRASALLHRSNENDSYYGHHSSPPCSLSLQDYLQNILSNNVSNSDPHCHASYEITCASYLCQSLCILYHHQQKYDNNNDQKILFLKNFYVTWNNFLFTKYLFNPIISFYKYCNSLKSDQIIQQQGSLVIWFPSNINDSIIMTMFPLQYNVVHLINSSQTMSLNYEEMIKDTHLDANEKLIRLNDIINCFCQTYYNHFKLKRFSDNDDDSIMPFTKMIFNHSLIFEMFLTYLSYIVRLNKNYFLYSNYSMFKLFLKYYDSYLLNYENNNCDFLNYINYGLDLSLTAFILKQENHYIKYRIKHFLVLKYLIQLAVDYQNGEQDYSHYSLFDPNSSKNTESIVLAQSHTFIESSINTDRSNLPILLTYPVLACCLNFFLPVKHAQDFPFNYYKKEQLYPISIQSGLLFLKENFIDHYQHDPLLSSMLKAWIQNVYIKNDKKVITNTLQNVFGCYRQSANGFHCICHLTRALIKLDTWKFCCNPYRETMIEGDEKPILYPLIDACRILAKLLLLDVIDDTKEDTKQSLQMFKLQYLIYQMYEDCRFLLPLYSFKYFYCFLYVLIEEFVSICNMPIVHSTTLRTTYYLAWVHFLWDIGLKCLCDLDTLTYDNNNYFYTYISSCFNLSYLLQHIDSHIFSTTLNIAITKKDIGLPSKPFLWTFGEALGHIICQGKYQCESNQVNTISITKVLDIFLDVGLMPQPLADIKDPTESLISCLSDSYVKSAVESVSFPTASHFEFNAVYYKIVCLKLSSLLELLFCIIKRLHALKFTTELKKALLAGNTKSTSTSVLKIIGYDFIFLFPPLFESLMRFPEHELGLFLQHFFFFFYYCCKQCFHEQDLVSISSLCFFDSEDVRLILRSTSPSYTLLTCASTKSMQGALRQSYAYPVFCIFLYINVYNNILKTQQHAEEAKEVSTQWDDTHCKYLPFFCEAIDIVQLQVNECSPTKKCFSLNSLGYVLQSLLSTLGLKGGCYLLTQIRSGEALDNRKSKSILYSIYTHLTRIALENIIKQRPENHMLKEDIILSIDSCLCFFIQLGLIDSFHNILSTSTPAQYSSIALSDTTLPPRSKITFMWNDFLSLDDELLNELLEKSSKITMNKLILKLAQSVCPTWVPFFTPIQCLMIYIKENQQSQFGCNDMFYADDSSSHDFLELLKIFASTVSDENNDITDEDNDITIHLIIYFIKLFFFNRNVSEACFILLIASIPLLLLRFCIVNNREQTQRFMAGLIDHLVSSLDAKNGYQSSSNILATQTFSSALCFLYFFFGTTPILADNNFMLTNSESLPLKVISKKRENKLLLKKTITVSPSTSDQECISYPLISKMFMDYWKELDLSKISYIALKSGLLSESHFLIYLYCKKHNGYKENILQPVSKMKDEMSLDCHPHFLFFNQDDNSSKPPLYMQLLITSLQNWNIGLFDACRGTLSPWTSYSVLRLENASALSTRHPLMMRLAFLEKNELSSFSNCKCIWDNKNNITHDLGWKQEMGLLRNTYLRDMMTYQHSKRKDRSCSTGLNNLQTKYRDLEAEYLWRLGQWDMADALYYKEMTPQESLLDILKQLVCHYNSLSLQEVSSSKNECSKDHIIYFQEKKDKDNQPYQYMEYNNRSNLLFKQFNATPELLNPSNLCAFGNGFSRLLQIKTSIDWNLACYGSKKLDSETPIKTLVQQWINDYQLLCHFPSLLDVFEPVTTFRRVLLSSISSSSSPCQENNLSILLKRYLIEHCHALGLKGLTDIALLDSINIVEDLHQKKQDEAMEEIVALADWKCIKGFWESGHHQRALFLSQSLTKRLQAYCNHDVSCGNKQFATKNSIMINFILASVGRWMFESQWNSLEEVAAKYFKPVWKSISNSKQLTSSPRKHRTSNFTPEFSLLEPHRIYAELLDEIIQSRSERQFSREAAVSKSLIQSIEVELELNKQELKKQLSLPSAKKNVAAIQGLEQEILRLTKSIEDSKGNELQYSLTLVQLANEAIYHYSSWLKATITDTRDSLRAASRVISLWFHWGSKPTRQQKPSSFFSNVMTTQSIFHSGFLKHFRYFAYQLAARLDDSLRDTDLQKTLISFIVGLTQLFPFDCIFPLVQLKNGAKIPEDHRGYDKFAFEPQRILGAENVLSHVASADEQDPNQCLKMILEAIDCYSNFFIHLANLKLEDKPNNSVCIKISHLPNYRNMLAASKLLPSLASLKATTAFDLNEMNRQIDRETKNHSLPEKNLSCFEQKTQHTSDLTSSPHMNILLNYINSKMALPTIHKFDDIISVTETGISRPKVIGIWDTSGLFHKQIVKGRDDLRQDAVMEQLFRLLNKIFIGTARTRERNLQIRTYQVVPLSPVVGIVQWVSKTTTLAQFLTGPIDRPFSGAHGKWRPTDITTEEARKRLHSARTNYKGHFVNNENLSVNSNNTALTLEDILLQEYQNICQNFRPVMDLAFLQLFDTPQAWFMGLQRYLRSLAVNSMVGYIAGIGDRHANNVLIDVGTGELVHIDFGIAFGKGAALAVPEIVPFRMTPDLVTALGPLRFNGPFRVVCEVTLEEMRQMASFVSSVVEVFLYDPLYQWTLNPRKAWESRGWNSNNKSSKKVTNPKKTDPNGNLIGREALIQVREKLLGLCVIEDAEGKSNNVWSQNQGGTLAVPSMVERLLRQAVSPNRLAMMFAGWSPWL